MPDQASSSGVSLEKYRRYLAFLARTHVDERLNAKVDLSGIVQQTLLEAHQNQLQVNRSTLGQQMAYLRHHGTQCSGRDPQIHVR